MKLKKLLTPDAVLVGLRAANKDEVLEEMVGHLFACGRITDYHAALECVRERERKMSTGMQNGIAIPHGKTDSVDSLQVVVAVHAPGIDFQSLDGRPAQIFVMTVSPACRTGPHIQFLAEVSRLLNDAGIRRQLLQAATPREAAGILAGP